MHTMQTHHALLCREGYSTSVLFTLNALHTRAVVLPLTIVSSGHNGQTHDESTTCEYDTSDLYHHNFGCHIGKQP